ncbi:suppressor of tumorigenicity 14 protein homolog [Elysia marginata]|uniref:Suppressor of tumorigenicity 14 protein homolog n=1 Tax=Elysia marginata TaxID=1093978 RepID=A0AAV4J858_9GAST|nr:suppressor of tumorigenicity 14 protein homolog [Elysia marginata]
MRLEKLHAEFHAFHVGQEAPCDLDKLLVDRSGSCEFRAPIKLCGDLLPQPITSLENILCLRFTSVLMNYTQGFTIRVNVSDASFSSERGHVTTIDPVSAASESGSPSPPVCSEFPVVIWSNTSIHSPNFGKNRRYPRGTQCRWLVSVDSFHKVILRFQAMSLEYHPSCLYDYIRVFEGEELSPTFDLRFCGSALPLPVEFTTSKLIMFSSDQVVQYYGFSASLEFTPLINSTGDSGSTISGENSNVQSSHKHFAASSSISIESSSISLFSADIVTSPSAANPLDSSSMSTIHTSTIFNLPSIPTLLASLSRLFVTPTPTEHVIMSASPLSPSSISKSRQSLFSLSSSSAPPIRTTISDVSSVPTVLPSIFINLRQLTPTPPSLIAEQMPLDVSSLSTPSDVSTSSVSHLEPSSKWPALSISSSSTYSFQKTILPKPTPREGLSGTLLFTPLRTVEPQYLSKIALISPSQSTTALDNKTARTLSVEHISQTTLNITSSPYASATANESGIVLTSLLNEISANSHINAHANNSVEETFNDKGVDIHPTSSLYFSSRTGTSDGMIVDSENNNNSIINSSTNKNNYSNNINTSNSSNHILYDNSTNNIYSTVAPNVTTTVRNETRLYDVIDICSRTTVDMTSLRDLVIVSPGFKDGETYPPSTRCDLLVRAPPNKTIHGQMMFMDLEQHECAWDWLEVTSRFKMLGRFCGTEQVYFRSEDIVLLTFNSDAVVNKAGFRLYLSGGESAPPEGIEHKQELTMCSAPILSFVTEEEVLVTSPGYIFGSYPTFTECDLRLFTSEQNVLVVRVLDLELEDHPACNYDYVNFLDGVSKFSAALARMCGTAHVRPPTLSGNTIVTSGASLWIHFFSDPVVVRRGFRLGVRSREDKKIDLSISTVPTPRVSIDDELINGNSYALSSVVGNTISSSSIYPSIASSSPTLSISPTITAGVTKPKYINAIEKGSSTTITVAEPKETNTFTAPDSEQATTITSSIYKSANIFSTSDPGTTISTTTEPTSTDDISEHTSFYISTAEPKTTTSKTETATTAINTEFTTTKNVTESTNITTTTETTTATSTTQPTTKTTRSGATTITTSSRIKTTFEPTNANVIESSTDTYSSGESKTTTTAIENATNNRFNFSTSNNISEPQNTTVTEPTTNLTNTEPTVKAITARRPSTTATAWSTNISYFKLTTTATGDKPQTTKNINSESVITPVNNTNLETTSITSTESETRTNPSNVATGTSTDYKTLNVTDTPNLIDTKTSIEKEKMGSTTNKTFTFPTPYPVNTMRDPTSTPNIESTLNTAVKIITTSTANSANPNTDELTTAATNNSTITNSATIATPFHTTTAINNITTTDSATYTTVVHTTSAAKNSTNTDSATIAAPLYTTAATNNTSSTDSATSTTDVHTSQESDSPTITDNVNSSMIVHTTTATNYSTSTDSANSDVSARATTATNDRITTASTNSTTDVHTLATTTDPTAITTDKPYEEAKCGGDPVVLSNQSGTIIYPGQSGETNYTSNTICIWIIEGGKGKNISFHFVRLDIEDHPSCIYDFLEVYEIKSTHAHIENKKLLGRFCGSTLPGNITSAGERLEVKFSSDRMVTGKGFEIEFTVSEVDEAFVDCPYGRVACRSSTLCIPTHWLCDGEIDCPRADDEEHCDACPVDQFSCSDATCVSLHHVCDGVAHCTYGEDELDCVQIGAESLMIRMKGAWFPVCAPQEAELALDDPIAEWACEVMGHRSSCESKQVLVVQCDERDCGRRGTQLPQPYVLGSTSSVDGQWPWMVAIFSGDDFRCGGTLISAHWVVTAGHCVYNLINSPQTTTVVLGHVNIVSRGLTRRRVTEIVMHPENNYIYENDIALLRLQGEAEVSEEVRPLCLPHKVKVRSPKTPCYVAGWGVRDKKKIFVSELSPILQHAKLRLWTQSNCEAVYPNRIKSSMICAGYQHGEVDACKGDSGGPLMCLSRPDQWELVGVVSWGEGCGQLGKPGVYTRVDSFLYWIQESTRLYESVSCDFEHPTICGYSARSEGSFLWSRRVGGVHFPARPMIDRTFRNTSGHYIYAHIPYGQTAKTALLLSPPITNETGTSGTSCLRFHVIFYSCGQCTLAVRAIDTLGNESVPLARFSDASLEKWMRVVVELPINAAHAQFSAYSGSYSGGGVGLDDVAVFPGKCQELQALNCEFDDVNTADHALCGYHQDNTDDFDWQVTSDNSSDGFVRASLVTGSKGYKARFVSTSFKNEASVCFKIRFRVSDADDSGTLQICKQLTFRGNNVFDCSIWTSDRHKLQGGWQTVQLSVPPAFLRYSLVFEATRGSVLGYVDVDSVHRQDGDCL